MLNAVLLLVAVPTAFAVKSHDFKTCSQAGFCRRGRALATRAQENPTSWKSPYSVDAGSLSISSNQASFTAAVKSSLYPQIKFDLDVRVHDDGVIRVRMDEVDGIRKRYDEAASWALIAEPRISKDIKWTVGKNEVRAKYGPKKDIEIVIAFEPLKVTLLRGGKEQMVINGRGLLHMEHFRTKAVEEPKATEGLNAEDSQTVLSASNPRAWFEGDSEDAYWEEQWSSWTDSKPKGL